MSTITDYIRAQYPDAGPASSKAPYCVGGALRLWLNCRDKLSFPTSNALEPALLTLNEALDDDHAHRFARRIIQYNDTHQIDKAWDIVAQALSYRQEE